MTRSVLHRGAGVVMAGLIAWVLPSSAAQAYRLLGDDPTLGVSGTVKWHATTVSYDVAVRGLPVLSEAAYRAALQRGFDVWKNATCDVAVVERGTTEADATPSDGANTVQWIDDWEARGFAPEAIATTDVELREVDGEWQIVEFDIYFQRQLEWATDGPADGRYRVEYTAAHEAGHALGIAHPCEESDPGVVACGPSDGELMHPIYASRSLVLTTDDIDAVCALYGCGTIDLACGESSCSAAPELGCPCVIDADCGSMLCVRSRCAMIRLPDGDGCVQSNDCQSGACVGVGTCATSCPMGGECGPGAVCIAQSGGTHACGGEVPDFATACFGSDECVSGLCVVSHGGDQGMCTRVCADVPCPAGFVCVAADGDHVCAAAVEDGGCVASGARSTGSGRGGTAGLTAVLLLFMMSVRRKRVSARHRGEQSV